MRLAQHRRLLHDLARRRKRAERSQLAVLAPEPSHDTPSARRKLSPCKGRSTGCTNRGHR